MCGNMVTKSTIERRLSDLEARMKPKRIETISDFVLSAALRDRYGDDSPMPELSPAMAEFLEQWDGAGKLPARPMGELQVLPPF